jgi:transitional endoplasmic reticulum ATPase
MTYQATPSALSAMLRSDDLPDLLPAQVVTYARLKEAALASPYVVLAGPSGMGRTILLDKLAREIGAPFIQVEDMAAKFGTMPHDLVSESIYELLSDSVKKYGAVVLDDFFMLTAMKAFPITPVIQGTRRALRDLAVNGGYTLVIGGTQIDLWATAASQYGEAVTLVEGEALGEVDYQTFLSRAWGENAGAVDYGMVYRAARGLDIYQLKLLAGLLQGQSDLTTADVLKCMEEDILSSNLQIGEVEAISFDKLPGAEEIAAALERHIVLPFQNQALAEELGLKPSRGVLLYGPPGTGKTSIGRALAHRMKGRFFLIDGTVVTEPPSIFFGHVSGIVRDAKANAPSVLFIDDADVLFQIDHIAGLSRFLLTLLDGLESATANTVCVVMTAMDAQKIPEALLRSGRIELWLETKTPDETTRARMIERWLPGSMGDLGAIDYSVIARETEGFTPADLRRLAGDARLLYAADLVAERPAKDATGYMLSAVEDLISTRAIMAERLADDALRIRPYA